VLALLGESGVTRASHRRGDRDVGHKPRPTAGPPPLVDRSVGADSGPALDGAVDVIVGPRTRRQFVRDAVGTDKESRKRAPWLITADICASAAMNAVAAAAMVSSLRVADTYRRSLGQAIRDG
jgi:hypothetical protein